MVQRRSCEDTEKRSDGQGLSLSDLHAQSHLSHLVPGFAGRCGHAQYIIIRH